LTIWMAVSCGRGGVFKSRTPHDKYTNMLTSAGLEKTALGRQWLDAAQKALDAPLSVEAPHAERGFFSPSQPRAVGLLFSPKRGEKLSFEFSRQAGSNIFLELWKLNASMQRDLVKALDSTEQRFSYEVTKDEKLLLRIQPELLTGGEYSFSVTIGPSLAFPVPGNEKNIGSLWGAPRGGGRLHEGIDIFASRGTPTVAAEDGTVSSVTNNRLGGKVIFMRTSGKNLTLYYAHLDSQLVRQGQRVSKGDTLGLVGNTGNAVSTPPHLHFGIYTSGGAIDPLAFVDPVIKRPGKITAGEDRLGDTVRTKRSIVVDGRQLPASTAGILVSATSNALHILLPDGTVTKLAFADIQFPLPVIRTVRARNPLFLLENPSVGAARIGSVPGSATLKVLGTFREHLLVETGDGMRGWVSSPDL
jgi:peptidoglycan LD-endopeptidase LytH